MLNRLAIFFIPLLFAGCSTTNYYIVRHAEKAQVSDGVTMQTKNDPPLTPAGEARAQALQERLKGEKISAVYSTNTIRTISTAQPTASRYNLSVQSYSKVDSPFVALLKQQHGNVLIVGHSNTVDDIVNMLTGMQQLSDLPDAAYDNLFIVKKKGNKFTLVKEKFGAPAH